MMSSVLRLEFVCSLFIFGQASFLLAASCCGGNSAVPSIISGDDAYQMTASLTNAEIVANVAPDGSPIDLADSTQDTIQTLNLDAATILGDRFQIGVSLPIVRRAQTQGGFEDSAMGLGDVTFVAAYEAVPVWEYSLWKPRVFLFAQPTLPTGGSIYDGTTDVVRATGRGFYSLSTGALITKDWQVVDMAIVLRAGRSLAKTVNDEFVGEFTHTPGWSLGGTALLGYSPLNALRLGTSVSVLHHDGIDTRSDFFSTTSSPEQVWSVSLQASYLISDEWSTTLAFSDQTLLGSASTNTGLRQSLMLQIQKRWPM